MGIGDWGVGCGVWGLGFEVWGLAGRVQSSGQHILLPRVQTLPMREGFIGVKISGCMQVSGFTVDVVGRTRSLFRSWVWRSHGGVCEFRCLNFLKVA